mgnify:CR=1 FL=1
MLRPYFGSNLNNMVNGKEIGCNKLSTGVSVIEGDIGALEVVFIEFVSKCVKCAYYLTLKFNSFEHFGNKTENFL